MSSSRIAIVGAGPTGLGAAHRLEERGHRDYVVLEADEIVGGLSRSFENDGFTWDVGGHVAFSHYPAFDGMLEEALPEEPYRIERRSFIRIADTWVPYPIQNNLRYLPPEMQMECLMGLLETREVRCEEEPETFFEWMHRVFGSGFARIFMEPYNFKVWATPPELMSHHWISERVSVIDFERALRNIVYRQDDTGWGPNNTFAFPKRGGTGAIWQGLAGLLGERVRTGARVENISPQRRVVTLRGGEEVAYDRLISTMPLDKLARVCEGAEEAGLAGETEELMHSGTLVVGVGLEKPMRPGTCWMYFPEADCPFYRVTNFAQYSNYNVPGGDTDRYSSFMCETSYSPFKPADAARIVEETIQGLVNVGLMEESDRGRIATTFLYDAEYGYPIPTVDRDEALGVANAWFERQGIYSRGRFGAWRYEVGNMDHSYQMGREAADRILDGKPENVLIEGLPD